MDQPTDPDFQPPQEAAPQGFSPGLRLRCFGAFAAGLLRAWGATWRTETLGEDPRKDESAQLAAFFHEGLLPAAHRFRDRGYSVAVSRSRDGDRIASVLERLGYEEAARGSSSRGGSAALLGLVRRLEAGTTVSVLVDGPRGPARVAKTGIIALARHADQPIVPVAFSARPAIRLGSWDRSLIPLPFARVVCAFGEPIEIDRHSELDPEAYEQQTARLLERKLVDLHHAADRVLLA